MTQQREQLVELQRQLQQRLAKVQSDLQSLKEADSAEQAQQRENDEVLQDLAAHLQKELLQLHIALEREAQGKYGVCIACGDDIAAPRLKILPFATHCQHCAH
ncbi:MAG TPA: dimethylmenaquinone methyltransferase [Rheinheimera sp.]|nr:dimethylmenaquinone methyltransferase [Rheinheimera sp.]